MSIEEYTAESRLRQTHLDKFKRVLKKMNPPHQPLQLPIKLEGGKEPSPVASYERHLCHPHPAILDHSSSQKKIWD